MCLNIICKNIKEGRLIKKNPFIAKKDIIVYKVLRKLNDKSFETIYQDYPFNPGDHLYQTGTPFTFRYNDNISSSGIILEIHRGLHSFTTEKAALEVSIGYYNRHIFKMIIPKGSKYYLSIKKFEIVSDNLIFPWNAKPIK